MADGVLIMSKLGKKMINAMKESISIARGEVDPSTYKVHHAKQENQMSEMIERVARALAFKHDQANINKGAVLAYNAGSIATDYWNGQAKAAIEAMREPTEQMIKAGMAVKVFGNTNETYKSMIDAALKE